MAILNIGFHDGTTGGSNLPALGLWQEMGTTPEGLRIVKDTSNGGQFVFDPSNGGMRRYDLYQKYGVGEISKDINPYDAIQADGSQGLKTPTTFNEGLHQYDNWQQPQSQYSASNPLNTSDPTKANFLGGLNTGPTRTQTQMNFLGGIPTPGADASTETLMRYLQPIPGQQPQTPVQPATGGPIAWNGGSMVPQTGLQPMYGSTAPQRAPAMAPQMQQPAQGPAMADPSSAFQQPTRTGMLSQGAGFNPFGKNSWFSKYWGK